MKSRGFCREAVLAVFTVLLVATPARTQPGAGLAQVRFAGPAGMKVWLQSPATGRFTHESDLVAPGRLNLRQGQTYRLRLADIPRRPGQTFYPTLQIAVADARAATFLRNSAIQVELTREDFDEAAAGRLVTRSINLADGPVLAVLRMGNIDLETPGNAEAGKPRQVADLQNRFARSRPDCRRRKRPRLLANGPAALSTSKEGL